MVEFLKKQTKDKEMYIESEWSHVDEAFRKQGIASDVYDFARELGNDIRASSSRTAGGRGLWKKQIERESGSVPESDYRPVLPRKQKGSFDYFDRSKQNFADFKKETEKMLGKGAFPDVVLKALWRDKNEGKRLDTNASPEAAAIDAIDGVPGIREKLGALFSTEMKSFEEIAPLIDKAKDIPGSIVSKAGQQLMSGMKAIARYYDNPMLKAIGDHVNAAKQNIDKISY